MWTILFWGFIALLSLLILTILLLVAGFAIADHTNGKIVCAGETRRYLLYVPSTYTPTKPAPLVISIHGFAEWPAHQAHISRWNALAEEEGFIVVYPSGTGIPKHWRASALVKDFGDPQSDIRFIADLIDRLQAQFTIDPHRIYVNGLSNGAGMSVVVACHLSDRIAAIGGVAGAYIYPLDLCAPARPMPLIVFHGDADPIVPYLGGPSRSFNLPFPAIPQWVQGWAERNGCKTSMPIPQKGEVSGVRYSDCDTSADVIFYTIAGGGHSWPGGNPIPRWIVGRTSQDIDATRLMWNFFLEHTMK